LAAIKLKINGDRDTSRSPAPAFVYKALPPNINTDSRPTKFNAGATMMIVVSVPHVEAIIPLDARGSTGALTADFFTNTIRASGNSE
jgi:hypothetical protein